MSSRISLLAALFALPLIAAEPDWPQFRGPKRNGHSPDKGLLKSWPADGPTVAWKADGLGDGFSSVAVVGDKVLTMGDSGDSSFVFAVSRKDGSKVWEAKVGRSGGGGGYPGPRCTPTADGDHVYALGQYGDLVCIALADGKERWRVNLPKDYKGSGGGWGYAESPLVDGDKLIVTPGGREATMLALDKNTGKVKWKGMSSKGESAGYSSVMVSTAGGVRQYVTLTSLGVMSFGADSGKLLWEYGSEESKDREKRRFAHNTANIPTVVLFDDPNRIFAAAGYGRGGGLFELRSEGGDIEPHEIYWKGGLTNKHGGVIRVGDYLYGDQDDSGHIWCAEAKTGKVAWARKDRSEGSGSASMCYADGMLYVRYQNGWVSLVAADPKAYRELSTFRVENGRSNCWAHPVVIGGKFYVREKDVIWCYDVAVK
ncbi:MAG TPA: PQQ-binding-like beta-propeller repeat protein [Gemmataceae bacterium]|nr:PQQ-binding-like beta-propeller repeat protein [Gemmataceae bacterium]